MSPLGSITWVLEADVFPDSPAALKAAAVQAGHRIVSWRDEWWDGDRWPRLEGETVVFHGSLGNAARIRANVSWRPGAFCDAVVGAVMELVAAYGTS